MKKKLKDLTAEDIIKTCDTFYHKDTNQCTKDCPLYNYTISKCRTAYIKKHFDEEVEIESGELCDREEVRKETAREILKSMLNKMYKLTGCGVPYHVKKFIEEIAMEYGIELEDEE